MTTGENTSSVSNLAQVLQKSKQNDNVIFIAARWIRETVQAYLWMHVNPSQKLQDALSQVNNTVVNITAANDEQFEEPKKVANG